MSLKLRRKSTADILHPPSPPGTPSMLDFYANYLMPYYVYRQLPYVCQLISGLVAAVLIAWLVSLVVRYRCRQYRRPPTTEIPPACSTTFPQETSFPKGRECLSPTRSPSQSARIPPSPARNPRGLGLPVYRPIERPVPKYPLPRQSFRVMLEGDSSEEEFVVGEGVDRTSSTVLHGESAREGQSH